MATPNLLKPKALVLSGDGINCEKETAQAAKEVGFETRILHSNDLLADPASSLRDIKLFLLPGGFSFGDELGSGKIMALKLQYGLREVFEKYLSSGGAVLGICNGFQVLVRLGVFGKKVLLAQNAQGHFLNRWVGMRITGQSIFTDRWKEKGITHVELPMRHGEGRLVFSEPEVADQMWQSGQCALQYEEAVNGSWNQVAALSAYRGKVLGMMPHPEAFWSEEFHPRGGQTRLPLGIEMFENAYLNLTQR